MKFLHTLLSLSFLLCLSSTVVSAIDSTDTEVEQSIEAGCQCPTTEQRVTERRRGLEDSICERAPYGLARRADGDGSDGGGGISVGAGVDLPSVGLSLGNITTKLGNINLTVTNVTISLGNVDVEDISIGNISVIVSVPLPGASPVQAFSAFTPGSSISSSTATPTSTVSSTSTTQAATTSSGFFQRLVRQESDTDVDTTSSVPVVPTVTLPSASATATVSGGPVDLGTGNINTEIGNITILVGHVNVSVGDIKIKNITVGNIFVLVQIGQPDV
ncbi:hypothetical protein K435DRAFT_837572 [Dendrothele bispora CBS 962.96]|uniref:Uncharacterized protein n=1 Tax=Dendrothele bispora (strain CBS 962.96) TaxID=1314807 RepID=A0A4S8MB16_DENBC|nr:hypothetical protein K435DRAFT_837572 [Dendrothele bispora CBS 962.96]